MDEKEQKKAEKEHQKQQLFRLIDSYTTENIDLALVLIQGNPTLKEVAKRRYYPLLRELDPSIGTGFLLLHKVKEALQYGYLPTKNARYKKYDFAAILARYYRDLGAMNAVLPFIAESFRVIKEREKLQLFIDLQIEEEIQVEELHIIHERSAVEALPMQHLRHLKTLWLYNAPSIARQCVEQGHIFYQLTFCNLENCNLQEVPEALADLPKVDALYLSRNALKHLPPSLAKLQTLRSLHIDGNPLKILPDWIQQLPLLSTLAVGDCQLKNLPEWLYKMPYLRSLYASRNEIEQVSPLLFVQPALIWIELNDNKIQKIELPADLSTSVLYYLELKENPLRKFPLDLCRLPKLTTLNLEKCQLETIPDSIDQLQHLDVLGLENNQIKELCPSICQLKKLKHLYLFGNPIDAIPDLRSLPRLEYITFSEKALPQKSQKEAKVKALLPPNCKYHSH